LQGKVPTKQKIRHMFFSLRSSKTLYPLQTFDITIAKLIYSNESVIMIGHRSTPKYDENEGLK